MRESYSQIPIIFLIEVKCENKKYLDFFNKETVVTFKTLQQ